LLSIPIILAQTRDTHAHAHTAIHTSTHMRMYAHARTRAHTHTHTYRETHEPHFFHHGLNIMLQCWNHSLHMPEHAPAWFNYKQV